MSVCIYHSNPLNVVTIDDMNDVHDRCVRINLMGIPAHDVRNAVQIFHLNILPIESLPVRLFQGGHMKDILPG